MSSSRIAAAIASLPHTRFDGAPGAGRSISSPAIVTGFSDGISTALLPSRQPLPHAITPDPRAAGKPAIEYPENQAYARGWQVRGGGNNMHRQSGRAR